MKTISRFVPLPLLITVILIYSCTPEPQDPNPPINPVDTTTTPGGGGIPPASDSVTVLSGTGGFGFLYGKDAVLEKLYYLNFPGEKVYDTTYLFYNANKKISRLVCRGHYSIYDTFLTPKIAIYSGNVISKIYEKKTVRFLYSPEYNDPNYFQNIGSITPANIESYDSMNYDASQRLISKYHFVSSGSVFKLDSYTTLDYHNPNGLLYSGGDSLLYLVQLFRDETNSGTFTMRNKVYFHGYDVSHGKSNPLYIAFKEYALFRGNIMFLFNVQPIQQNSDDLDNYLTLNPYPINRIEIKDGYTWSSYVITLAYDANGRLSSASSNSVFAGGRVGYSYKKVKK